MTFFEYKDDILLIQGPVSQIPFFVYLSLILFVFKNIPLVLPRSTIRTLSFWTSILACFLETFSSFILISAPSDLPIREIPKSKLYFSPKLQIKKYFRLNMKSIQ